MHEDPFDVPRRPWERQVFLFVWGGGGGLARPSNRDFATALPFPELFEGSHSQQTMMSGLRTCHAKRSVLCASRRQLLCSCAGQGAKKPGTLAGWKMAMQSLLRTP